MTTEELIHLLAEDAPPRRSLPALPWFGVAAAIVMAAAAFFILLHPRPDLGTALGNVAVLAKFLIAASLTLAIAPQLAGEFRPTSASSRRYLYAVPAALLIAALTHEFVIQPTATWSARLMGENGPACVLLVIVIALAPLATLLYMLHRGATTRPARAGAIAGLAAGSIAAFFYALHCPDDSPLFFAFWYAVALLATTGVGAWAGSRLLRW